MKTVLTLLIAALAALLLACGGGGCDRCEPEVPTPKVDCKAEPEVCK